MAPKFKKKKKIALGSYKIAYMLGYVHNSHSGTFTMLLPYDAYWVGSHNMDQICQLGSLKEGRKEERQEIGSKVLECLSGKISSI